MGPPARARLGHATRRRHARSWLAGSRLLLVVTVVSSAAMLRAPIVAVAPVAGTMADGLDATAAVFGLLTSIPVLAFALCAPLAVAVVRRGGPDLALSVSLAGAVAGCVIRSSGGLPMALVGTAVLGVFLTIGNVVVPVVISGGFPPARVHMMTGVYIASMNIGTMLVMVATAPLAGIIGWRGAIAVSAVFGITALASWLALRGVRSALLPHPSAGSSPRGISDRTTPRRRSGADWLLGGAFAGQAFSFYTVVAWLPTLLADRGFGTEAAGTVAGVFQVAGIAGALLIPVLAARLSILTGVVVLTAGWLTVPLGFLWAPELWPVWCVVGGLAQGGGLTVVFIMINALGGDQQQVTRRSGLVQGIGYALAACGPVLVGGLHEGTGAWTVPLLTILGAVAAFGGLGSAVAVTLARRGALPRRQSTA